MARHTTQLAQRGWAKRPDDTTFWSPSNTTQLNTLEDWNQMTPWWQDTRTLWLKQQWK